MGRKTTKKKTRKMKRTDTFTETHGMSPQEFLGKLSSLPNDIRTKENIREAKALV